MKVARLWGSPTELRSPISQRKAKTSELRSWIRLQGGDAADLGPGFDMPGFGADFKQKLKLPGRGILVFCFGECLPNHENFIELDKTKVDAWGVPVLRIHAQWRDTSALC